MQRRRHGHRRSLRKPRKLAMRERQLMLCLHFTHNIVCRMLYIAKAALQRPLTYTLISHTNTHAVRGGPTLNYVERFRNGLVNKLYSLKASQVCKVHTSSHKITNSEPYVQTTKILAKLCQPILQQTMMQRRTPHLLKKSRMFANTTSEVALTTAN